MVRIKMDIIEIVFLTLNITFGLEVIAFWFMKNRVKKFIFDTGDDFIDTFLNRIEQNPEIVMKVLNPVVIKMAKQFGIPDPSSGGKDIKLFGFKLPSFILEKGLGMIMKKGTETAEEINPFG